MRRIDWNATARTGQVQVRIDVAERALTSWVLLDVSPSMTFGTADRRKWDVAEGAAVALGHIASRRGNRIGVVTFGGGTSQTLRPRQGRAGLLGVLLAVRRDPETEHVGQTSLGAAFTHVARVARNRALVAVVSDFRGPRDWRASLLRLASRHEVLAIEIRDPREQEIPTWATSASSIPRPGAERRSTPAAAERGAASRAVAAEDAAALARELHRSASAHRPLDSRRLAAAVRLVPGARKEAAMSFATRCALWALLLDPVRSRPPTCSHSGGGSSTPPASRTSTC